VNSFSKIPAALHTKDFIMQSPLRCLSAACFVSLGLAAASHANVITVTSGQAGGGVVINPARVVAAVDAFGQQGNTNVVQGVTFTTTNPHVSISQAYGGQVSGGGPNAIGSFDGSVNPNDVALTNIDRSIIYGGQTITLSGLTPNGAYNLQLLTTDGGYNERMEDFTINGTHTDTVDVQVGQTYNVTNLVHADGSGTITVLMSENLSNPNLQDPNPTLAAVILSTPEPSSLLLGGLGVVGLILAARRHRQA
jgi:hypothetical protein